MASEAVIFELAAERARAALRRIEVKVAAMQVDVKAMSDSLPDGDDAA